MQDFKKNNGDFLYITSLNTFIKNTKMFQKHQSISDLKEEEKGMLQNIKISKSNADFMDMTYVNTFIKKTKQKDKTFLLQDIKILKKKADFLHITSLNICIKTTKMFQKHLSLSDFKKEEKVMLQISEYQIKMQIFWI